MNDPYSLIEKAAETLGEHYDSVVIICTRHDPAVEGGTIIEVEGVGNSFAREGSVRSWLRQREAMDLTRG